MGTASSARPWRKDAIAQIEIVPRVVGLGPDRGGEVLLGEHRVPRACRGDAQDVVRGAGCAG